MRRSDWRGFGGTLDVGLRVSGGGVDHRWESKGELGGRAEVRRARRCVVLM
jgi:hypothetical protein